MTPLDSANPAGFPNSSTPVSGWAGHSRTRSDLRIFTDPESLRRAATQTEVWLPRGSGCSYGDAALSSRGALFQSDFGSELRVDPETCRVKVPSSIRLGELLAQLSLKGLTLPVVPGFLGVTVGGMVAADIHGKNHYQSGSFRNSVEAIELVLPNGERLRCSRHFEAEIFNATLGGMGLTGFITAVDLLAIQRSDPQVDVRVWTTESLAETIAVLDQSAAKYDHSSAWVDYSCANPKRGRGVILGGRMLKVEDESSLRNLWQPQSGPRFPPLPLPGEKMIRWHNELYYQRARWGSFHRRMTLEGLLFPLEAWSDWKRVYGPAGFHQHQCLIPENAGVSAIEALLDHVEKVGVSPTLVVIKRLGEGFGGLSFPAAGWTVSMDFAHSEKVVTLMERLNELVADVSGRVYLAKDSTLTTELLERMYPDLQSFREVRQQVDPEKRISSSLSTRLGL